VPPGRSTRASSAIAGAGIRQMRQRERADREVERAVLERQVREVALP
jgi:hypothetical protein